MIKIRESATHLALEGPNPELAAISQRLQLRPESYWMSKAYQLYKMSNGARGWDGWFRPLSFKGTKGSLLRGYKSQVLDMGLTESIDFNTDDLLTNPFAGITIDDIDPKIVSKCPHTLDTGQQTAVAQWLGAGMGGQKVVVGGGKTLMFAATYAHIKARFPKARLLYLTPTERLVKQVFTEFSTWFPHLHITQFGGSGDDETGKDGVIVTVAKLRANFEELVHDGWFKTFMMLAIDEQHHAPADSWTQTILACNAAFFRFGASDSSKELDAVGQSKMTGLCGPELGSIQAEGLIVAGRLARPTIHVIDIPEWNNQFKDLPHIVEAETPAWVLDVESGQWSKGVYKGPAMEEKRDGTQVQAINQHSIEIDGRLKIVESRWCLMERLNDKAIVSNKARNRLLAQWAAYYSGLGHPTLMVATRTLHCKILEATLHKLVDPALVQVLWGEHSTKERDAAFAWFAETPGAILVSPLVKEGVSIPEIKALIVADHVVSFEVMGQIIGRSVRRKPSGENTAEIVISIDRHHPRLRRNGIHLLEELEKIRGYAFRHPCFEPETREKVPLWVA